MSRQSGQSVIAIAGQQQINLFDAQSLENAGAWSWAGQPEMLFLNENGEIVVFSDARMRLLKDHSLQVCHGLKALVDIFEEKAVDYQLLGLDQASDMAYGRLQINDDTVELAFSCDRQNDSEFLLGDKAFVATRSRYRGNFERWGRPSPYLKLGVHPNFKATAAMDGRKSQIGTVNSLALFYRLLGDQFIIVSKDDIYQADVDAVLSHLMAEGAP